MAVSAAAMLVIAATLTTIVFVRANADRDPDDQTFTTASADNAARKPVKPQPVANKTDSVTATAQPTTAAVKPLAATDAAQPAGQTAEAPATELAEGDGGPQVAALLPEDGDAQAFADPETTASEAAAILEQVGSSPPLMETTSAIPTPRPADGPKAKKVASAAQAAAPAATGTGRVLRSVTLRVSGTKNAAQIGTIPANAEVDVIQCKSWCKVTYKGETGWIYKSFLDR